MLLTITLFFIGLVLMIIGLIRTSTEINDYLPSRAEIDSMRDEALKEKDETAQALMWMSIADDEAELRASLEPRFKWGKIVLALGVAFIATSIIRFL